MGIDNDNEYDEVLARVGREWPYWGSGEYHQRIAMGHMQNVQIYPDGTAGTRKDPGFTAAGRDLLLNPTAWMRFKEWEETLPIPLEILAWTSVAWAIKTIVW